MERSIFTALIGGLLGITAFGGLALVGSVPGTPEPPPSRPEGEWRLLDPVSYENISLYPVVSSYSQDTSSFLTLEEGLATGEVAGREKGPETPERGPDGRPGYIPQPSRGGSGNQPVLNYSRRGPPLPPSGEISNRGQQVR